MLIVIFTVNLSFKNHAPFRDFCAASVPPCDEHRPLAGCVELLFLPLVAGSAKIDANRLRREAAVAMGRRQNLLLVCFLISVVFKGKNHYLLLLVTCTNSTSLCKNIM